MNTVREQIFQFIIMFLSFFFLLNANICAFGQDISLRCATVVGNNQQYSIDQSQFGGIYLTATGLVRILLVFVSYSDDNSTHPYWPAHQPPTYMSNFIDPSASTGSTNFANLTNYFNQMSRGLYHVIGEAVYVETPHPKSWYPTDRAITNADVLQNAVDPLVNFANYDNWTCDSNYHHRNVPDGTVDMIVMVWRGSQFGLLGEASLGYGGNITLDGKTIKFGYGGNSGSGVTCSYPTSHWPEKLLQTMSHEIGHWLLGGSHPYDPYGQPAYAMWGILGPQYASGTCMNSYERERVGWINCTPVTEVNAPLADYVTSGVAYKYHPPNGDANEYIYFENHQKISIYDDASSNPNDKGILALQQEGLYGDWPNVRTLPQDGRWNWQNPHYNTTCFPGSSVPVFKKLSVQRDETGYSYRDAIPTIQGNKDWMLSYIDPSGNEICGGFMRGDAPFQTAFNSSVNTVLSPWSNPNTNTWNNNATTLGVEVVSQNGSTITVHFYQSNPLDAAPSRPQFVQATYNTSNQAVVTWTANQEGDVTTGGGYDVYRSLYYDGATLSYTKVNSSLLSSSSFTDNSPAIPSGIPAGKDVYWRYNVKAIDNTSKVSVASEDSWLFVGKTVPGTISTPTTWSDTVYATSNVTISNNATLTIAAGTTVLLGSNVTIEVSSGSKIIADGTQGTIRFKQLTIGQVWNYIDLGGSNNQFSYCVFDGGAYNVYLNSANNIFSYCSFKNASQGGIYAEGGNNNSFNNCVIDSNSYGIIVNGGNPTIDQTTIKNNTYDGLYAADAITNFTNNVIENNGRYGIYADWGSTIYMGKGTGSYNSNYQTGSVPAADSGAGRNRIKNNVSYQIYVEEDARLYAGSLDGQSLIAGYNKISSTTANYIYNLAMTGEYENQQQWVLPASMTRWGESGGMEGEGIYGQVCYSYQLNFDPSASAGASGTVPLNKVTNPESASKPITVLTSAIAAKISSTQTTSSQGEFLVDLKNQMIKVNNDFNDPKNKKIRPRLLGSLNDLSVLDPNDATQEKGMIGALLAEYRTRLITNPPTDSVEILCSEAALVCESKNALREKDISQVQALLKTYGPYVKNKDNVRSLLFAEMSVYERGGDYAKAWEKLGAIKAIKPNDDLKKIYVAPSYKIMEERLQEKAKAAGIVLSKQESTEEEKQNIANEQQLPKEISLQNYPNPFNPSTVISYQLSVVSNVKLSIFDIRGREVAVLQDGMKQAGRYSATFDASRLSSGIYFSRLTVNPQEGKPIVLTKKMLLMK